jgi:hypothetical protein
MKAKITVRRYLPLQEKNRASKARPAEIRQDFAALQSRPDRLTERVSREHARRK